MLRVLADRKPLPARFLILGSASPELLRQSSESLAGRLETIPIAGLSLTEVGVKALNRQWQRGGFPLSFLARNNDEIDRRDFDLLMACYHSDSVDQHAITDTKRLSGSSSRSSKPIDYARGTKCNATEFMQ
jgi:hypothetical protein